MPFDFETFLRMYPNGRLASVASMKLRMLQRENEEATQKTKEEHRSIILPIKRGRDVLNPIIDFFQSLGAVGGFVGSLLVISASLFIDVKMPIKDASIMKKSLFVFSGTLVGGLFFITVCSNNNDGKNVIICMFLGAFWLHVVIAARQIVENYLKGLEKAILEKNTISKDGESLKMSTVENMVKKLSNKKKTQKKPGSGSN